MLRFPEMEKLEVSDMTQRFTRGCIACISGVASAMLLPATALAWTPPVAVDLPTTTALRYDTVLSVAAGSEETRGVVWASDGEATDTLNGVYFSRSSNGGNSWSPVREMAGVSDRPFGASGSRPCLTTDRGNVWVIGWDACQATGTLVAGPRDIYITRSTDAGVTWSSPSPMSSNAFNPLVRNYNMSMATNSAGVWLAVCESDVSPEAGVLPLSRVGVARSVNHAESWMPVEYLDPATSQTLNQNPHVATNGQGTWIVGWDSTGTKDTDIRFCRSVDQGATWSVGKWLNTHAAADDGTTNSYDGNVRLAGSPDGTWVAVWTSNYNGDTSTSVKDRIVFSRSTDNGLTWSPAAPVDPAESTSTVRQMPDVIWTGSRFAVIWSGPDGLEVSYSATSGLSWTPPASPVSGAAYPGGPESRPRLTTGVSGRITGAWVNQPQRSAGPAIISAKEAAQAAAANWQLYR